MEKYRKFDDPRVGVNPFTPLKVVEHSALYNTGRIVSDYSNFINDPSIDSL